MKNLDIEKLAFEFQTTEISLTKMAEREGTTRQTLAKYFKGIGIEVINKQNKSKFNEHIFDVIDTEEKAYWLGFIFADGYIGSTPIEENKKSVYNFELSLQLLDVDHLNKFKEFLSYEKNVVCDDHRCRLMVANKHFWNILNNYGCTPRKSLTLKFPSENIFIESDKYSKEDLIRHFIRGYFDGDGCLSRHKYINTVSLHVEVLGTEEFLDEISKYSNSIATLKHDKRHTNATYSLEYSKEQGTKFINYLYQNANIYLDRKFKLYEFFKNGSRSIEEFIELSQTNIGEKPKKENTEISTEIKRSVPSYSVGIETSNEE